MRIVVADDHQLFRHGLRVLLHNVQGVQVVGEAHNGAEAVLRARDLCPDIVLMDLEMPEVNGVVATQLISEKLPHSKVVVLSAYEDNEHIYAAMKAGARGYIIKRIGRDELVRVLFAICRGEIIVSPYLANLALQEVASACDENDDKLEGLLTEQELQVLHLIAEGHHNATIADLLCISKETVKVHLKHIFSKLQVDNRTKAAVLALKHRLISL